MEVNERKLNMVIQHCRTQGLTVVLYLKTLVAHQVREYLKTKGLISISVPTISDIGMVEVYVPTTTIAQVETLLAEFEPAE